MVMYGKQKSCSPKKAPVFSLKKKLYLRIEFISKINFTKKLMF